MYTFCKVFLFHGVVFGIFCPMKLHVLAHRTAVAYAVITYTKFKTGEVCCHVNLTYFGNFLSENQCSSFKFNFMDKPAIVKLFLVSNH